MTMPNMIVTASDRTKPRFVGDVGGLNRTAKVKLLNIFIMVMAVGIKRELHILE